MTKFPNIDYKKLTMALFIISTAITSIGCGNIIRASGQYKENISHILITKDKKTLVAIGNKHHYIFKAPDKIIATLNSSYVSYVTAQFVNFKIDESNTVTGYYKLNLTTRFNTEEPRGAQMLHDAQALCYKKNGFRSFLCGGKLTGIRYKSGNIKLPDTATTLNQSYEIVIRKPVSTTEKALTPIIVTEGKIIEIASIPLIAVGMGFATILNNLEH